VVWFDQFLHVIRWTAWIHRRWYRLGVYAASDFVFITTPWSVRLATASNPYTLLVARRDLDHSRHDAAIPCARHRTEDMIYADNDDELLNPRKHNLPRYCHVVDSSTVNSRPLLAIVDLVVTNFPAPSSCCAYSTIVASVSISIQGRPQCINVGANAPKIF